MTFGVDFLLGVVLGCVLSILFLIIGSSREED